MPPATLSELVDKYFTTGPNAATIHSADSSVEVLVDGEAYLSSVRAAIDATTGAGDAIYILAWWLQDDFPTLLPTSDPAARELKALLAAKAQTQVDVRVVMWANVGVMDHTILTRIFSATAWKKYTAANIRSAVAMRSYRPDGASSEPLAGRVLLDWSGHLVGSHHQKAIFVKAGAELSGFAAGIDLVRDRWDRPPHDTLDRPNPISDGRLPWGWHDAGVKVTGGAALDVFENFKSRWDECASLPQKRYDLDGTSRLYNPTVVSALWPPMAVPALPTGSVRQSVQVVRSLGRLKTEEKFFQYEDRPWTDPALANGLVEIFSLLLKALGAARTYIYIEDQAFEAPMTLFPELVEACNRDVKVIAILPGVGDPNDLPAGEDPTKPPTIPPVVQQGLVEQLSDAKRTNLVLYQVKNTTVHSKIILIDDEFLCIGSANFMDRSMTLAHPGTNREGRDSELSIAAVDAATLVRDTRRQLWADHLGVSATDSSVQRDLDPLPAGLGMWRSQWGVVPSFSDPDSRLVLLGP